MTVGSPCGDERGVLRCVDCGAELEPTLDAAIDMLKMIAERKPELAPTIASKMEEAASTLDV